MKFICEETKNGVTDNCFEDDSDPEIEECDRICRLHWPQVFSPPCIHALCHVTFTFLTLEVERLHSLNLGHGHATCFGRWDVSRCDAIRGLTFACVVMPVPVASATEGLLQVDCWSHKNEKNVK